MCKKWWVSVSFSLTKLTNLMDNQGVVRGGAKFQSPRTIPCNRTERQQIRMEKQNSKKLFTGAELSYFLTIIEASDWRITCHFVFIFIKTDKGYETHTRLNIRQNTFRKMENAAGSHSSPPLSPFFPSWVACFLIFHNWMQDFVVSCPASQRLWWIIPKLRQKLLLLLCCVVDRGRGREMAKHFPFSWGNLQITKEFK